MGELLAEDVIDIVDRQDGTVPIATLRILLVDDDPAELAALQQALDARPIAVVGTTDSGEHALDLAALLDPNLAVIRWSMRHFGGALTARLMRWHAPRVTPVLLLVAEDLDEVADTASTMASVVSHSSVSELPNVLRAIARTAGGNESERTWIDPGTVPAIVLRPSAGIGDVDPRAEVG
jgi:DNA-binding NarL/FixJ family response regulator